MMGLASPAAPAQMFLLLPSTSGTQGMFCCCSSASQLCDGHQDLLRGRGSHCKNPQGIMADPHTCDRLCWIQPRSAPDPLWVLPRLARAVPGQSTVVNPDPARSNRQGDQFNQFSPQPPTQLHLALGPGQDLPAPVQGEHSSGRPSQKHCQGFPISRPPQPGSPIPAPSPAGSTHAATGTKPPPATAGRAAVPTGGGPGVGSLLFIPVVPAWKC